MHVKRDIHQQKHAVFEGSSEEVKEMANIITSMIEMVKNHSTTVAYADLGKQMIKNYLHNLGQHKAAEVGRVRPPGPTFVVFSDRIQSCRICDGDLCLPTQFVRGSRS